MVDEELICTLRQLDGNNPRIGKLMMQSVLSIFQLYSVIDDSGSVFFKGLQPPEEEEELILVVPLTLGSPAQIEAFL